MLRHRQHLIDRIANWNGIFTGLALWPQAMKAFVSASTEDLSIVAFLIILVNSAIWLMYAMHRNLRPLKISSSLNIIASVIIVGFILNPF